MQYLRNFHIFQAAKPRLLKYGLDGITFYIREAASLGLFKNRIKTWKYEDRPCRSCKNLLKMSGVSD